MAALLTFRTKSRSPGLQISAPTTNPTLTVSGTDLTPTVANSDIRRISIPAPPRTSPSPSAHSRTLSAPSATLQGSDSNASSPHSTSSSISTSPKPSTRYSPGSSVSQDSAVPDAEFNFPRPSDLEIDALVERLKATGNLVISTRNLSHDEKWLIVSSDARMRWLEEKKGMEREAARARSIANGQTPPLTMSSKDSPDWYLKRFMNDTITPKQVASVCLLLRTKPLAWLESFAMLQGVFILALKLHSIDSYRRNDNDILLEHEILKCLRIIIDSKVGTVVLIQHQPTIDYITESLNTPNLAARKLVLDILCFCVNTRPGPDGVIAALDARRSHHSHMGVFEYWFKGFSTAFENRNHAGNRMASTTDAIMNEYTLVNIRLVNIILGSVDDLDRRMHLRSQMNAAGLGKMLQSAGELKFATIDQQLDVYEEQARDEQLLLKHLGQDILYDIQDPQKLCRAILDTVEGSPAHAHFLSTMRHLLLIRAETDPAKRVRYYQLIDTLVMSIVLDTKADFKGTLSDQVGVSVGRLLAQLEEQDQAGQAVANTAIEELRAQLESVTRERDALQDEVAIGVEGFVGKFKAQLEGADAMLKRSSLTTEALKNRLEEQKRGYEEQIRQLEMQIKELFRMLRDARAPDMARVDRTELVSNLQKQMEVRKTLGTLQRTRTMRESRRQLKPQPAPIEEEDIGAEDEDIKEENRETKQALAQEDRLKPQVSKVKPVLASQSPDADEGHIATRTERGLQDPGSSGTMSNMVDATSNLKPSRPLPVRRSTMDTDTSMRAVKGNGLPITAPVEGTGPPHRWAPLAPSNSKSSRTPSSKAAAVNSTISSDERLPDFADDSDSDDETATLNGDYRAAAPGQDADVAALDQDDDIGRLNYNDGRQRHFSMLSFDSGTVFDDDDPDHVAAKSAYYRDDDAASIRSFNSILL